MAKPTPLIPFANNANLSVEIITYPSHSGVYIVSDYAVSRIYSFIIVHRCNANGPKGQSCGGEIPTSRDGGGKGMYIIWWDGLVVNSFSFADFHRRFPIHLSSVPDGIRFRHPKHDYVAGWPNGTDIVVVRAIYT